MGLNGLEPSTSRLSGVRSNQLSYRPQKRVTRIGLATKAWKAFVLPLNHTRRTLIIKKWRGTESNRRHKELQSFALPTELPSHPTVHIRFELMIFSVTGRRDKPLLQWTILREVDLNHRPSGYEPDELPDCSIPRLLINKSTNYFHTLWTL